MAVTNNDTASFLVRKIRTCQRHERRTASLELAATQSESAIRELIRMVEARRRHWFSFYDSEDQLIGVEALGNTGSQIALEYLQKVYEFSKRVSEIDSIVTGGGSEPRDDDVYTIRYDVYTYPRARGGLAGNLRYKEATSVSEEYHGELEPENWPHCAVRETAGA